MLLQYLTQLSSLSDGTYRILAIIDVRRTTPNLLLHKRTYKKYSLCLGGKVSKVSKFELEYKSILEVWINIKGNHLSLHGS